MNLQKKAKKGSYFLAQLIGLLATVFIVIVGSTTTAQATIFFEEQFNTLDLSQWEVSNNGYPVPVSVSGGFINMGSSVINSRDFPYVLSKINPFPTTGDFALELGFQYTGLGPYGDGLHILDSANNATAMNFWQDSGSTGGLFISGVGNLGINTNYHVLNYVVQGSIVTAFLDGVKYQSFSLGARPTQIWFGHPTIGQQGGVGLHPSLIDENGFLTDRWWGNDAWSTFKLDFIRTDIGPNGPISTPEPATMLLLGLGLMGLAGVRRKGNN